MFIGQWRKPKGRRYFHFFVKGPALPPEGIPNPTRKALCGTVPDEHGLSPRDDLGIIHRPLRNACRKCLQKAER